MSTQIKIYAIYFSGHYPVGAVATVVALDEEQAIDTFLRTLFKEEPSLIPFNPREKLKAEILFQEKACHILLNGDY